MFEYKFITIKYKGIFKFTLEEDHVDLIRHEVRSGWRYIGLIPIIIDGHGKPKSVDFVFERPVGWQEKNVKY